MIVPSSCANAASLRKLASIYYLAANELKAQRAEHQVAEQQIAEGRVLAPAAGRILKVPVTEGSVMLAGESVATIAANAYLLRLELPERHACFMKKGDPVRVGARGLSADQNIVTEGRIIQVYPEVQSGRVVADAEVATLGDYFVGERALVWISAGKRRSIVVPAEFVFKRIGLEYARVAQPSGGVADVVLQTGSPVRLRNQTDGVEILAGLKPGDVLLSPAVSP